MKLFLSFLFLLSAYSCTTRKQEISQLVKEWQNKEIIFPDSLETRIFGRDTVCPGMWKARYKIFNYTDTSGCTECRMKLYEWKRLKKQVDSLNLDVSFIFAAWVNQYDELETLQSINKCNIPFIYDRTGRMMQLNHFPTREGFQTFLLDSANRVILIGNPLETETLRNLYLKNVSKSR